MTITAEFFTGGEEQLTRLAPYGTWESAGMNREGFSLVGLVEIPDDGEIKTMGIYRKNLPEALAAALTKAEAEEDKAHKAGYLAAEEKKAKEASQAEVFELREKLHAALDSE